MTKPWPMVPLGEVLTKSDELIDLKPEATYSEVTVRLWGKGVVQRREVSGAGIATQRRSIVGAGQFILSRIDARNGAFGLIPDSLDGAVVSNDFPVFNLNPQKIDPKYLAWMSRTHAFIDLCKAASEGTTNRVRLKEDRFLAAQIPLPPLSEQKRIVSRIEELAAKIEEAKGLRQKAVEEAEALLQAALRCIFCLKEPKFQLGEVLQLQRGFDLPVQQRISGRYPVFAANGEIGRHNEARVKGPGVVTGRSGSIGAVNYVQEDYWPLNTALYVRDFKNNDPRLIYYLLRAISTDLRQASSHTAVPTLDRKKAHTQIWVHVPPLPEQRRIVAYLDDLQAKVDALKRLQAETAVELDAMLPSVLDKAFKGEM